jgi:hypothetical protein
VRKTVLLALGLVSEMALTGGCMSEPSEHLHVDKQVRISPAHRVMPYSITRASNGDLFVIGSNDQMNYRAWATRVAPSGEVRWEYLEGGPDGWNDRSIHGQKFYGTIEMPDQTTLLCGEKMIDRHPTIMLVTLAKDGSLISEKLLPPIREGVAVSLSTCRKWNDGIALLGSVSGQPAGTGWMVKLDMSLNMQWKKFGGDYGNGDIMDTGPSLYALGGHVEELYIVKIGVDGEIVAKHVLPDAEHYLVHGSTSAPTVRIVSMLPTFQHTEIFDLDGQLRGPTRTLKLHNVGVKKCLELLDGTVAIFGSQFTDSATAAITRVYKDGGYKTFLVQPQHQSPWYIDAVLTGNDDEIAAVRQVDSGYAIVDFLSFK